MDVNRQTAQQLCHYLQRLVEFSDPHLLVGCDPAPDGTGLVLRVVRDVPDQGVMLCLTSDFLRQNQDARILDVIRERVKHWLSRGLPELAEDGYLQEDITITSHGSS
ncbi:hypothetical protein [Deinococcus roseus]|uniref:Uncharacterized protein n=1 Tax=Deinococcus roseus TaxID=392414 RepID=A0ABQ2D5T0_9DEIO|nr:hypothetical protein [Deinococcus roseus]GGJ44770.1 hypothetical protein GCM10008938_33720 [Deinococcus roseus]